jgi:plastocyanin
MRRASIIALLLLLACASVALAKTTKRVSAREGSGSLSFSKSSLSASKGKVTLKLRNPASNHLPHSIDLRGNGVKKLGKIVDPGGTSRITVRLKRGTYEYYCRVKGHVKEGMTGTLTVN